MKSFYSQEKTLRAPDPDGGSLALHATAASSLHIGTRARVAVYDAPGAAPRVEEVGPAPLGDYIERLATCIYDLARAAGGTIPFSVVREVTENFIHADFREPVVSIMRGGTVVRFADQGPGIADKDRAVQPGFTTASGDMKRYIRGVGSGLPIVRDYLSFAGGSLLIEDNLGAGSVVTITTVVESTPSATGIESPQPLPTTQATLAREDCSQASFSSMAAGPGPRLSTRQKQVLALVLETGSAGPSLVAKELGVGLSTAYRDLASLEEAGLITADNGKRAMTPLGLTYLDDLSTR
jgi:hypothetical protein